MRRVAVTPYSACATATQRGATNHTPFLYNAQGGAQTDPNGLRYMRAGYYNPYVSRFTNADPSGFNGGLNFYLFCNDNPINAEDPFGLGDNYISATLNGPSGTWPSSVYAPGGAFSSWTSTRPSSRSRAFWPLPARPCL